MVLLNSIDIPLGEKIPSFNLKTPDGKSFQESELFGEKGLLLVITCNHCPYAIAIWDRLIQLSHHAKKLGVNTVAINPNIHPNYPDDAPEKMLEKIKEWNIPFPYLVDETQEVAKALKAQCTPDLYLYNENQELVYHGELDDNWQEPEKVTKEELKLAIEALAHDKNIDPNQKPSMGCSIKWKD
jgi:peroxiredoxin